MSDINPLPGIGLALLALGAMAGSLLFAIVFLLSASFGKKEVSFRLRKGVALAWGMLVPFILGILIFAVAEYAPLSWRTSLDAMHPLTLVAMICAALVLGFLIGLMKSRRS